MEEPLLFDEDKEVGIEGEVGGSPILELSEVEVKVREQEVNEVGLFREMIVDAVLSMKGLQELDQGWVNRGEVELLSFWTIL